MAEDYTGKFGTEEKSSLQDDILNVMFLHSEAPTLTDTDEALETPILVIDLDEVNTKAANQARIITERLSNYYFDQKYIDKHPYIPSKIAQEMDNIRRLIKMLAVNEKAQDTLITNITRSAGKGSLYQSLTSLQNSMLQMQNQLNNLTTGLETIFKEMQDNCELTFEEKDKEKSEDGSIVVRGSKDFIKQMEIMMNGEKPNIEPLEDEISDNKEDKLSDAN